MSFLSGPVVLLVAALFLAALSWPLVMILAYQRLRGIERALWAIRDQMERALPTVIRQRHSADMTPEPEMPRGARHVSGSMFGR
jgi:hypothetical protein